jgi:hypothetical protein
MRHEHTTKLAKLIKELREHVSHNGSPGVGHRNLNQIVADAFSAVDDEMAAIDAAARDSVSS